MRASWTSADDLAGQPGPHQLGRQVQVERDRLAVLVDDRPALARTLGDDHVVGGELDRPPSKSTVAVPARRSWRRAAAASAAAMAAATCGVCLPNRLPRLRKLPLAVWSTRSPADANDSTVSTLSSAAISARSSSSRSRVGRRRDQRAPQRLPGLDLRLGARRPAELDQPAGQRHPRLELVVDRGRRRTSARSTGAPTPARRGRPRTTRSCQTRSVMNGVSGAISRVSVVEGLVQGGERRRVAVPEPAARAPDVPVGHVVDELGEQGAGPLGVEDLERVGDVAGQAVAAATAATGRARRDRRRPVPSASGVQPLVRA